MSAIDRKRLLLRHYPEAALGGFTAVDGTVAFYSRVNALVPEDGVVLDVGCGRGAHQEDAVRWRLSLRDLRGKCRRVIGIDVDPEARRNPFLDEFRRISDGAWPIESASVDLCLGDWVVEHVAEPSSFFQELARVVRPGGYVALRTPNVLSYFGVFARSIPNRFHSRVVARVQAGSRQEEDVFHTYYRCNTRRSLRRHLGAVGFRPVVYGWGAEPSYLGFSGLAYRLGVWYQRWIPQSFQPTLFAFGERCAERRHASKRSFGE